MKLAITGASGFIGTHLRRAFPDHIAIKRQDSTDVIKRKLQDIDVVVNLAGAPIIKHWSKSYKEELVSSRINTTKRLVEAMKGTKVKHFISTSAIGIYPDNTPCDEDCPRLANDFLGNLANMWEKEALGSEKPTTILRLGVILGKEGGALNKMLLPFRLGLGGPIGDGAMIMSWLDIEDLMRIYRFVIQERITGTLNAVSPNPVTNLQFTKTLGKVLGRPTILPVPGFALKLIYGEAAQVLIGSKEVYPKVLKRLGFKFKYPDITQSLRHILASL